MIRFQYLNSRQNMQSDPAPPQPQTQREHFSMNVLCKFQDLTSKQIQSQSKNVVRLLKTDDEIKQQKTIEVQYPSFKSDQKNKLRQFSFQDVLQPQTKIIDFYERNFNSRISNFIQGKNVGIYTYGQTGSGKSSIIFKGWYGQQAGIDEKAQKISLINKAKKISLLQLSIQQICNYYEELPEQQKNGISFSLKCFQIYNERIYDQLSTVVQEEEKKDQIDWFSNKDLPIKQAPQKGIYIQGLSQIRIDKEKCQKEKKNMRQLFREYLDKALKSRCIRQTNMGMASSRSHYFYQIQQKIKQISKDLPDYNSKSRIIFVDFAGSQRVSKTNATGNTLQEAIKIGASLCSFGNVISALTNQKATHVPYRDSKLTRYLTHLLAPGQDNTMICCVNTTQPYAQQSLSTIRFGTRLSNKTQIKPSVGQKKDVQ